MSLLKDDFRRDLTAERAYRRMREGRNSRDPAAERQHRRMTNPGRTRYGPGAETTGRPKWAREPRSQKRGASR